MRKFSAVLGSIVAFAFSGIVLGADGDPAPRRNVIIFVADGLRPGSVTADRAPTLFAVRTKGVNFVNSHSLLPTLTMPNSSAIATGHYLGDTSVFGNYVFTGFPVFDKGSFTGKKPGTITPFLEDDQVEGDVDEHFPGQNFLDEETLLAFARANGFNTAAIGKLGPTLIQDVTQGNPKDGVVPVPATVIIDDTTGHEGGVPLSDAMKAALKAAQLEEATPARGPNGEKGTNEKPGTLSANVEQQQFFVNALTKAVLPSFKQNGKPFVAVYWSRDPDGTQHNQGDSLNKLVPGINGDTSKAAVKNGDANLKQILDYLNETGLADSTDVFVTADHGFSTISRHDLDATGTNFTKSYAATLAYKDVNTGFLPPGFLAIDLAHFLNLKLFDPDQQVPDAQNVGQSLYMPIDPTAGKHPKLGDALLGDESAAKIAAPTTAQVVIGANGGSDLIWVPSKDAKLVAKLVDFLAQQDYVSGIFIDDEYGPIPGALPLSTINLKGSSLLPVPSIVVNFRTFATDPNDPVNTCVEIADYVLQQGQGMHGSFGRGDTYNNMAAIGPDFKVAFTDSAPVSNADVAVTLTSILHLQLPSKGKLMGRVIGEALKGGPEAPLATRGVEKSAASAGGLISYLRYQQLGATRYFDSAGFEGRTVDGPEISAKK